MPTFKSIATLKKIKMKLKTQIYAKNNNNINGKLMIITVILICNINGINCKLIIIIITVISKIELVKN